MSENKKLGKYFYKRDFSKTPEPQGSKRTRGESPIFIIQKHDATSLHYDFRLEVGGVLKSWAVPKGPATDPAKRRLAIPTEDHPLDYADFEGMIPEGEYGAGPMIVWDAGTYRNLKSEKTDNPQTMDEAIQAGKVEIWLQGEKLKGGYALIRTGHGDDARWLLIKMSDEEADARRNPTSTEPKSVLSGRTLEDIRNEYRGD